MSLKGKVLVFSYFLLFSQVLAQNRTALEIDELAENLVTQINKNTNVQAIAVAEFTLLDYSMNALGKNLTEELTIALIMHPHRNFQVINRSRLNALLEEAKLDADGLLAPENIPQLGRLRGIQMILGGFIRPASDHIVWTVKGVELETGDALVAGRQYVTMTPSLSTLNSEVITAPSTVVTSPESVPAFVVPATVTVHNLEIETKGCIILSGSNLLDCEFEITNTSNDLNLSVYVKNTQVQFQNTVNSTHPPDRMQLGVSKGSQRVSSILRYQVPIILHTLITPPSGVRQVSQITFKCYAPNLGLFDIQLRQIPVLNK